MKLDKEQEAKTAEEKNNALISAMQSQRAQILDEVEEVKLANKALQEELSASREKEKQLQWKIEASQNDKKNTEKDFVISLQNPHKFVEAARSLGMRQLQWVNYQLGLLVNSSYRMPTEPQMPISPYQMPPPQMYPYYQYPMMPMYKGPYGHYSDETED